MFHSMENLADRSIETKEPEIARKGIAHLRFRTRHLLYATALTMASLPLLEGAINSVKKAVQKMPYIRRAHQAWASADDSNNDYMDMLHVRHELVSADLQPWMAGFSQRGLLRDFKQAIENDIADYEKRGVKGETEANMYQYLRYAKEDIERRLSEPLPDDWLKDEKNRQVSW